MSEIAGVLRRKCNYVNKIQSFVLGFCLFVVVVVAFLIWFVCLFLFTLNVLILSAILPRIQHRSHGSDVYLRFLMNKIINPTSI